MQLFHAGTRRAGGAVVSAGGRVLNATARGATLAEARDRAYALADGDRLARGLLSARTSAGGR